jgi:hypothetical protein
MDSHLRFCLAGRRQDRGFGRTPADFLRREFLRIDTLHLAVLGCKVSLKVRKRTE